jgi:hypothetical protein
MAINCNRYIPIQGIMSYLIEYPARLLGYLIERYCHVTTLPARATLLN